MENVEALEQEIATLSAHLDAATHRLLECIRIFDECKAWHDQGALSCAHWLAWRIGWDMGTAREKVRVARALGELPAVDEALRSAKLSYAKVRAITRVATPQNEAKLLGMALLATGAQLERLCRGYQGVLDREAPPRPEERSVCQRRLPGGMVKLELVLEPDEAELVMKAIHRAREVRAAERATVTPAAPAQPADASGAPAPASGVSAEMSWPSGADGVVKLAESFLAGNPMTGTGGERFQVVVHLEQDALAPDGDWSATLEDGSRVSAETLRRVACDCGLVAAKAAGEALNIGRRTRSIPPAIRRALLLRDRGCAFPGCTHNRFLHGHHVKHWLNGGETSLDNLVMLCTFHHHLVHEGGWTVEAGAAAAGATFAFTFRSPAGALVEPHPPREVALDSTGWLDAWADERNLDLGPETNRPQWDGKGPDYDWGVGILLEAG